MHYEHELMNHGCQGTADYFFTLLKALKIACEHTDSGTEIRKRAFDAETMVVEDFLDTLDGFRKQSTWSATVKKDSRREITVEAIDEYDAKKKIESLIDDSEIIYSIGKREV